MKLKLPSLTLTCVDLRRQAKKVICRSGLRRKEFSKIIQNPTHVELQKAANQGRRCTWEKLSAIKANCGTELALDECVAILNHMRRLKRSAERAAAASHALSSTFKFSASGRIPSWNCIARENSTDSLEEYLLADVAASLQQRAPSPGRNLRTHRNAHDGSDSESESADLNSWTRSGGPLMRTTSANKFTDFVQNLDVETEMAKGLMAQPNSLAFQTGGRDSFNHSPRTTPDRGSENESDQRESGNRNSGSGSSIMVTEGDLLQPERTHNGFVSNVVKKEELALSSGSLDLENYDGEVAEVQIDCPEKEMDASSESEFGDDIINVATSVKDATRNPIHTDHSGTHGCSDHRVVDG